MKLDNNVLADLAKEIRQMREAIDPDSIVAPMEVMTEHGEMAEVNTCFSKIYESTLYEDENGVMTAKLLNDLGGGSFSFLLTVKGDLELPPHRHKYRERVKPLEGTITSDYSEGNDFDIPAGEIHTARFIDCLAYCRWTLEE